MNLFDQSKLHDDYVHFNGVKQFKENILTKAFENFQNNEQNYENILKEFYQNEKHWIDDFILFVTIKEKVKYKHFKSLKIREEFDLI